MILDLLGLVVFIFGSIGGFWLIDKWAACDDDPEGRLKTDSDSVTPRAKSGRARGASVPRADGLAGVTHPQWHRHNPNA